MTYPMEFRVAVAKAYDECGSSDDVAEMFNCSASWVRRLIQRRRLTDSLEPLPQRHSDLRKLREPELEQLRVLIEKNPDMTLGELAAALNHISSIPTIWRATRKLGLTLKKSPSMPPNKIDRT
jgi:transposase